MGSSCRSQVASTLLGLNGLVSMIRADKSASDYWIHNYQEYSHDARLYATVAAVVCNVADSVLLELLEDDRLALRALEVKAAMQEELDWIAEISPSTWAILAVLSKRSPGWLRSRCLVVAQCIGSFLQTRVFNVV